MSKLLFVPYCSQALVLAISSSTDALSDFDIVLVVTNPLPLLQDLSWQEAMGEVMVRLPVGEISADASVHSRLVLYADGNKIDYAITPQETLEAHRVAGTLPANLDVGYSVLLDKGRLTSGLRSPTYTAHITTKPSQAEFDAVVEEFFWETGYVAKNLWRGEVWAAKYSLEVVMKLGMLRQMLEWQVALEHDWTYRAGVLGRGLKPKLPHDLWKALEATFVGLDGQANWNALFKTINLFRWGCYRCGKASQPHLPHEP